MAGDHEFSKALALEATFRGAGDHERHASAPLKVVCYFSSWSQYRASGGRLSPEDVDPALCTHIVFAFARLSGGVLAPTEWNDISTTWSTGMYERINRIKANAPGLRTMLSLGGAETAAHDFLQMAGTAESRYKFTRSTVLYLRRHGFDGLDINCEHSSGAGRGGAPRDKLHLSTLLQDLRDEFEFEARQENRSRLLLSAAVPAVRGRVEQEGYSPANLSRHVDFLSVITYDFHGPWEDVTGPHNALYPGNRDVGPQTQLNQDWAVRYWLRQGVPPHKLLLGISAHARTWALQHALEHDVDAPALGPGRPGVYTRESGLLSYYEVCDKLRAGWARLWHARPLVPSAYGDEQWASFEDPRSVAAKAEYIREQGLGGAMFWTLDLDDFSGRFCRGGPFPLLTALNRKLTAQPPHR